MVKSQIFFYLLILLAILLGTEASAGTGAWPKGPDVFIMKQNLLFKGGDVKIMTNDTDAPSTVAKDADEGSIYIQNGTGALYKKTDTGSSTNWQLFIFGGIGLTGTDECLPRWDVTGSGVLQDSLLCITDTGIGTGLTQFNVDNLRLDGNSLSSTDINGNILLEPDGTGKVVVNSDLDVLGTITHLSSTSVDVTNATITVNDGGNQVTADANDAGIIVEMSDATDTTIHYDSTLASRFAAGDVGSTSEIITSTHAQDITAKTLIEVDNLQLNGNTLTSTSGDTLIKSAGDVLIDSKVIGTPAYTTYKDIHDLEGSTGALSDVSITSNGDGTVAVAAVDGMIRASDSDLVERLNFSVGATASLALVDLDTSWIYVEYNAGSPQIVADITERTDYNTNVLLGKLYREGTTIHENDKEHIHITDVASHLNRRLFKTEPYEHESGSIVSEVGTRNIAITAGVFWHGLDDFATPAYDTSAASIFSYFYLNAGTWVEVTAQTQIDNLQYNDIATGLQTLSNNKYGVHWVYNTANGHIAVIYGQGDYTLLGAQSAQPNGRPPMIEAHGFIIGKIIIQKSSATFQSIESSFDTLFTSTGVNDHNLLSNLQGGAAAEYYHLDATEFGFVDGQDQSVYTTSNVTFNDIIATGSITGNDAVLSSSAAGTIPLTLHGSAAQTADLFRIEDSGSTKLMSVLSDGTIETRLGADITDKVIQAEGSSNLGIAMNGTAGNAVITLRSGSASYFTFAATGATSYGTSYGWRSGMNGTSLVPAFNYANDPDTGTYRVAANNLGLSAGNTLAVDIKSDRVNTLGVFSPGQYATGSLPAAASYEGYQAYDTTLDIPVYSNGGKWNSMRRHFLQTDVFTNPSFEDVIAASGWTCAGGSAAVETTERVATEGAQSLAYTVTASTFSCFQTFSCTKTPAIPVGFLAYVNSTEDIEVCGYDGTNDINCVTPASDDTFQLALAENTGGATCGIKIKSDASITDVIYMDGIRFTDQPYRFVDIANATEWVDEGVMVFDAITTAPTKGTTDIDEVKCRRVGDSMEVEFTYSQTGAGTSGSGDYLFSIPTTCAGESGLTMDSTKTTFWTTSEGSGAYNYKGTRLGEGSWLVSGVNFEGVAIAYDATQFRIFATSPAANNAASSTDSSLANATVQFSGRLTIPVTGWNATSEHVIAPLDNNLTDWISYTPTTQGLGTLTNQNFYYKRVGGSILLFGTFTTGTTTGSEAQIGLPNGWSVGSEATTIASVGMFDRSISTTTDMRVMVTGGDTYINLAQDNAVFGASNGNALASAEDESFWTMLIPIEELSSDATILGAIPTLTPSVSVDATEVLTENDSAFVSSCTNADPSVCTFRSNFWKADPKCWANPTVAGEVAAVTLDTTTSATVDRTSAAGPFKLFCTGVRSN